MKSSAALETIAAELLKAKDLRLLSCTPLQSLWAGYGHICRIEAVSSKSDHSSSAKVDIRPQRLILKYVQPPTKTKPSKGKLPDEGHVRKVLSYQIEQYFYTHLALQMPDSIPVASCLSSINSHTGDTSTTAMIMTDLREAFPVAGEEEIELENAQVYAALRWLADFHGFWWTKADELRKANLVLSPLDHLSKHENTALVGDGGVWLNGGYTYLATRRKEYFNLSTYSASEWSSKLCDPIEPGKQSVAELVAGLLAPAPQPSGVADSANALFAESSQPYQTLLHGDIKSENLFTTAKGDSVAFYDFQYVGLGLGVCDLAKLFTCSVRMHLLLENPDEVYSASELPMQQAEELLLRSYLSRLLERSGKEYPWDIFVRHWETALVDWLRFQASWGFWGNSEWLEARVGSILMDQDWREWLSNAIGRS